MNRTTQRKLAYLGILAATAAVCLVVLLMTGSAWQALVFLGLILLIPGRVQGHYWRSFFRGRRMLEAGNSAAAILEFEHFLAELKCRPWLKTLICLNGSVYTNSAEAMALTNLGACHLVLGQLPEAEQALTAAIRADERGPLPYFNLAVLAQAQSKDGTAEELLQQARQLGYSGATADLMIHRAGVLLARLEGRQGSDPT